LERSTDITAEILRACVDDDRKAIKYLYEHCFKKLMPVCYRYHNNEEDARSSLNIGFMKILKGLDTIDEQVNFAAWSKRIMINTLIDEYRKKKNYQNHVASKETERELDVEASPSANEAESDLGYQNLLTLISQLPEISGRVFNLYVIDGYNHKEIGDLLGMSEGTSKWHLSTARKLLREKLEKIENQNQRMVI
jgi:RNA polymerase sigma-70 factor (ECF subfamily)